MVYEHDNEQCRLCLSSTSGAKCIYTTEDDNKISLATKIMVCTSLVVTSNDDKPQYLCPSCEETLESFFEFRNKCLHSHFQLCFDSEVTFEKISPYKSAFEEYTPNNLSSTSITKTVDTLKPLLLSESNTENCSDDDLYGIEGVIVVGSDDEEKNCSRQFQVGCYVDLEGGDYEKDSNVLRRFKCTDCLNVFSSLENLDNHWDRCQANKNKNVVHNSKILKSNENTNKESAETLVSDVKGEVQRVKRKSRGNKHTCFCGQVFSRVALLRKHSRKHGAKNRRFCKVCQKPFLDPYELKYHMRTHSENESFNCNECGKKFGRISRLELHLRTHTGERPYNCRYCEKTFYQRSHLISHERIHTGEKPYKCVYCPKTFVQYSSKHKHQKIHAGGTKMFRCRFCELMFVSKDELRLHRAEHEDEKPWKCELCNRCFIKHSMLKMHIYRCHNTDEKPFTCELCSEAFLTCRELKNHISTHTSKTIFQCEFCKMYFRKRSNLMKHISSKHETA